MFKVLFLSFAIQQSPESWGSFVFNQKEIHPIHRISFKFRPNINQNAISDLIIDDFQNVDVLEALEDVIRYKITVQYSAKRYKIYFVEQANRIKLNSESHSYTLGFKYIF